MYLMNTWPYICFVVNNLSQYLVEPRHVHLVVSNQAMRYLKGMVVYGLKYIRDHDFRLYGYTYSYFVGSVSYIKRTPGGCFILGSSMISWISRKQSIVSPNTAEVKYITACSFSMNPYGFESCYQVYSIWRWMPIWFYMIAKVAWRWQNTLCSMIRWST